MSESIRNKQFLALVASAHTILITSHIGPDPDAVSSSLLLAETLRVNYPDKTVVHALEERPDMNLDFLDGFDSISFGLLLEALTINQPDLLIITDANNYARITRTGSESIQQYLQAHDVQTIVIDHHEEVGKDDVGLFLNEHGPAAVQEVYRLCFTELGMKKPAGYAQTTMLGILSDTGRFKYYNSCYRETFAIVSDLIDAGANIEKIEDKLQRYTEYELAVIGHLAANITHQDNYSFSFISDAFRDSWQREDKPISDFKSACAVFVDQFIRNVEDRSWGFIVYPDLTTTGIYCGSFRAVKDVKDVSKVAAVLGGGGHQPSAGVKFEATTIEEATEKIHAAVKQVQ